MQASEQVPTQGNRSRAALLVRRVLFPGVVRAPGGERSGSQMAAAAWFAWILILLRRKRITEGILSGTAGERSAALLLVLLPAILFVLGILREKRIARGHSRPAEESSFRNRNFAWGVTGLAVLSLSALLAPILAPFDPDRQPADIPHSRYLPPLTRIHSLTLPGGERIAATAVRDTPGGIEYRRGGEWRRITGEQAPISHQVRWHIMGTDRFGRDLFSRVLYGARVSLAIGFLAVLLAATLGSLLGALAGHAGGLVDTALMRFVDVGLSLPRLFVILAVVGIFRPSILLIVLLLGGTGWMDTARLVRGQVLSLREREFVHAARAAGRKFPGILILHLLPNTVAPVLVEAALGIGNTILLEASLSYLGLGVPPPAASWGNLVSSGRNVLLDGWWISLFPGLAIVATVLSLNLLSEGLRERWNPRTRGPEEPDRPVREGYGVPDGGAEWGGSGRNRRSNQAWIPSGRIRNSRTWISILRVRSGKSIAWRIREGISSRGM